MLRECVRADEEVLGECPREENHFQAFDRGADHPAAEPVNFPLLDVLGVKLTSLAMSKPDANCQT